MKKLIQLTILLSMITTPFTTFASYTLDIEEGILQEIGFQDDIDVKCHMLIDMIKNSDDEIKIRVMKTTLEIELLVVLDLITGDMERLEKDIADYYGKLDQATTQKEKEALSYSIVQCLKRIEEYQGYYNQTEALLEHTR